MKKLLVTLLLLLSVLSCKVTSYVSDYTYFYKDTTRPQEIVDSLLGQELATKYVDWKHYDLIGIYGSDSTVITTYLNYIKASDTEDINISVTEFEYTDTVVVKSKIIRKGDK